MRSMLGAVPKKRLAPETQLIGGSVPYTSITAAATPLREGHRVSFREAVKVWLRVAALSFGGPAGQIAVMHRILVEEKRWIGETRFLHALNYCMLLPGPEAPVLAVVLEAVIRVGKRALKNRTMVAIAALAFIGIFFFAVPFPIIIVAAGLIGFAGNAAGVAAFRPAAARPGAAGTDEAPAAIDAAFARAIPEHVRPSARRAVKVAAIGLTLWLGPLLALLLTLGPGNVFTTIAVFFSEMAVVTFGGAYAVLAYVAQEAVQSYHWLAPGEMLAGLGMAETTPGPLIMVLQFVGFMAAFRHPGPLDPMLAGTLGGLLAAWVTFAPCFLWIFLGGPYIEALRGNKALGAALSAITAAVVGVILNLALWFALHTLFGRVDEKHAFGMVLQVPVVATLNLAALVLAVAALLALFRFKVGMIPTLLGCSAAGIALYFAGVSP